MDNFFFNATCPKIFVEIAVKEVVNICSKKYRFKAFMLVQAKITVF